MKAVKERAKLGLEESEKKVKYLEGVLKEVKKNAKKAVEEEQRNKETDIQATIDVKKIHFQCKQKHANDAQTVVSNAEEAQKKL